jgi:hypothetical protein
MMRSIDGLAAFHHLVRVASSMLRPIAGMWRERLVLRVNQSD